MSNVMIVGYPLPLAKKIRTEVERILTAAELAYDAITVIVSSRSALTKCCDSRKRAPYLKVAHTKIRQARQVAKLLGDKMNIDVEIGRLDGFIAKKTPGPVTFGK